MMSLIACKHADNMLQLCVRECVCVRQSCVFAGQTFNLAQMQKLFASQRSLGPCLPSLATTVAPNCQI